MVLCQDPFFPTDWVMCASAYVCEVYATLCAHNKFIWEKREREKVTLVRAHAQIRVFHIP